MSSSTHPPQDMVLTLAEKVIHAGTQLQRLPLQKIHSTLQSVLKEFPHILWHHPEIWKLAKVYIIMYHSDVDEDEDKNITMIEHAYIFAQRTIDMYEQDKHNVPKKDYFTALHTQVLLLATCGECYIPTLVQLYTQNPHTIDTEIRRVARNLSSTMLEYIEYALIDKITQNFDGLMNDEFLEDRCYFLEHEHEELSLKRINYAHKVNNKMIFDLQKEYIQWSQ
ncbi:MAG: hypothetical protein R6U95_03970 [Bacteroidales bacterium]